MIEILNTITEWLVYFYSNNILVVGFTVVWLVIGLLLYTINKYRLDKDDSDD